MKMLKSVVMFVVLAGAHGAQDVWAGPVAIQSCCTAHDISGDVLCEARGTPPDCTSCMAFCKAHPGKKGSSPSVLSTDPVVGPSLDEGAVLESMISGEE